MQYPDNFDFESTRLINAPKDSEKTNGIAAPDEAGVSSPINGVRDESAVENGDKEPVDKSQEQTGITRADELALKKDFKFAVWASVALVRFIHT